jgi:hypothetical protein
VALGGLGAEVVGGWVGEVSSQRGKRFVTLVGLAGSAFKSDGLVKSAPDSK